MSAETGPDRERRRRRALLLLLLFIPALYILVLFWAAGVGVAYGLAHDVSAQVQLARALNYSGDGGVDKAAFKDDSGLLPVAPLDPNIGLDALGDAPPSPSPSPSGRPSDGGLPTPSPAGPTTSSPSPSPSPGGNPGPKPSPSPSPAPSPSPSPGVPSGAVSGFVRDTGGGGLGGATVSIGGGPQTTSAGDGHYSISGRAPNSSYSLTATLSGYAGATSSAMTDGQGNATLNFNLTRNTGHATGHVKDQGGAPLAGATVMVVSGSQSTTSAADGSFSLGMLLSNTSYSIQASLAGHSSQTLAVNTDANGNAGADFTLPQLPGSITGHVYGSNGVGYAGASVGTFPLGGLQTTSGAGGFYTLSPTTPNTTYNVWAHASGCAPKAAVVTTDANGNAVQDFDLNNGNCGGRPNPIQAALPGPGGADALLPRRDWLTI